MAHFPFFALSRQDMQRRQKTEYEIIRTTDGVTEQALWKVTANASYGYPGPFDRKVFKAIEYLMTFQTLPVTNPVCFTLPQIGALLGMGPSGRSRSQIKASLRRIVATTIETAGSLYSKETGTYLSDTFHLIDRVVFRGTKLPDGRKAETNYLYLSDWYLSNVQAGYARPIDFFYQRDLSSDIASRLYELLSSKFYGAFKHHRPYVRIEYDELCALLPITPQKFLSKARNNLQPAHQELMDTGFLEKATWEDRYLIYHPGNLALAEFNEATGQIIRLSNPVALKEPNAKESPTEPLIVFLTDQGIRENAARDLVAQYPDRVRTQVEIFQWTMTHQPERIKRNQAGYLRKMIEEDWEPPSGFTSKTQQAETSKKVIKLDTSYKKKSNRDLWDTWQAQAPHEKIFGELLRWSGQFKAQRGREPSASEHEEKTRDLLSQLPQIEARYRQDILGVSS